MKYDGDLVSYQHKGRIGSDKSDVVFTNCIDQLPLDGNVTALKPLKHSLERYEREIFRTFLIRINIPKGDLLCVSMKCSAF